MLIGEIKIQNNAQGSLEIDIDGVIGVPEWFQFDSPEDKVATYDKFKSSVNAIKDSKAADIVVNIRSLGGSVNDALLIHDTLISLNASVVTNCYGYVASAATIIAQAASNGKRMMSDNSLYLVHCSNTYTGVNSKTANRVADLLQKTDNIIANIYSKRSGKPAEDFISLMSENDGGGKWLSPEEAKNLGLIDSITNAASIVNYAPDQLKAFNLPELPIITNSQTNNINDKMKLKNTWVAILNFFGFDPNKENELTEAQLEKLNNELDRNQTEITNLRNQVSTKDTEIGSNVTAIKAKDDEIKNLKQKVSDLEAEAAKGKAGATTTNPKEDPAPTGEDKKSPQVSAYEEDAKIFKN